MSVTKYVMTGGGKFVLASKYAGYEHKELAVIGLGLIEPNNPKNKLSGGFVYYNRDGTIQTFGRSESLDVNGNHPEDGQIIMAAIAAGEVHLESLSAYGRSDCMMAGNHASLQTAEYEVATMERLLELKIIVD